MKLINHFFLVIVNTFFLSATPNLFGSKRRREEKRGLASELRSQASEMQGEIDTLQTQNPFESAAAKSAMAASTRKARQIQQRFANKMQGSVNPEALVASQQATQESIAGTAGDIATGAEAQKKAEIGQLRNLKVQQQSQSTLMSQAAANEQGSGWRDFFSVLNPIAGGMKSGGAATAQ